MKLSYHREPVLSRTPMFRNDSGPTPIFVSKNRLRLDDLCHAVLRETGLHALPLALSYTNRATGVSVLQKGKHLYYPVTQTVPTHRLAAQGTKVIRPHYEYLHLYSRIPFRDFDSQARHPIFHYREDHNSTPSPQHQSDLAN